MDPLFCLDPSWPALQPAALAGLVLVDEVANPPDHAGLQARKVQLEAQIRADLAGKDRSALKIQPVLAAYRAYYEQFNKTYHVQLQLESIAWKARSIPSVAALVEAMFVAELHNLLLTAGHDASALRWPVRLAAAQGGEQYQTLSGKPAELKPGDLYMADAEGIISSILYGPDARTVIRPETTRVLFTVYAVPGISVDRLQAHLDELEELTRLIAPTAQLTARQILGGNVT